MNRRAMAGAMSAFLLGSPVAHASAESSEQTELLAQLIDEVIADGNMDNLDQLVTSDVTIATLGVTDIDAFRDVSIEGYELRAKQYESTAFSIESIAENDDWCHALVRFEGEKAAGGMEARSLFYVARFQDGKVQQLYLG